MSIPLSLKQTADGSQTLYRSDLDEHYHSVHGARQESMHVFIEMGLRPLMNRSGLKIFEMGFGTGLNALLTEVETRNAKINVHYSSLELYPLGEEEFSALDYGEREVFLYMHHSNWEESVLMREGFTLKKIHGAFGEMEVEDQFDLVYWDAFGPRVQPNLWTEDIFRKCHTLCAPGGVLVTYSAKGDVRRAMQAAGFEVERLPGPPGKREMLRATKTNS